MTKYCVLSLRENKEHQSPWFTSKAIAKKALSIIKSKSFKAVIYID